MTISYSLGLLIALILLFGLLLGWLLSWLLDSLLRRRRVKIVAMDCEDPHPCHEPAPCPDPPKKKVVLGVGNCEAKHFMIEPERRRSTSVSSASVSSASVSSASVSSASVSSASVSSDRIDLPGVRPCFELRWGDSRHDQIETNDVETICIVASNPYANVRFQDLTVALVAITQTDGSPSLSLPDGTPTINVNPSELIRFGDLAPANAQSQNPAACSICEVTLTSKGAEVGEHRFKLWYNCRVIFTMQQSDQYRLPIASCQGESR